MSLGSVCCLDVSARQAVSGTMRAIAQAKAAISRAMATTTWLTCFPRAVTEQQERLQRLERELHEAVQGWRLYPVVEAIQALRGVELTGAVILMTELGDLTRFDTPRQLMSYLGLTPSEYSSGARRQQGGITKGARQGCEGGGRCGLRLGGPTAILAVGGAHAQTRRCPSGRS